MWDEGWILQGGWPCYVKPRPYLATISEALSQAERIAPNLVRFFESCFSLLWTPDHLPSCVSPLSPEGVHISSPSFRGTLEINLRQHFWVISTRKSLLLSCKCRLYTPFSLQTICTNGAHHPSHLTSHAGSGQNNLWCLDLAEVRWPHYTFCVGNSATCLLGHVQAVHDPAASFYMVGFSKAASTGPTLLTFSNTKISKSIISFQ